MMDIAGKDPQTNGRFSLNQKLTKIKYICNMQVLHCAETAKWSCEVGIILFLSLENPSLDEYCAYCTFSLALCNICYADYYISLSKRCPL